jgi:hypothetical protein
MMRALRPPSLAEEPDWRHHQDMGPIFAGPSAAGYDVTIRGVRHFTGLPLLTPLHRLTRRVDAAAPRLERGEHDRRRPAVRAPGARARRRAAP